MYLALAEQTSVQKIFHAFDPQVQFWSDPASNRFQIIALPSHNLTIRCEGTKYKLLAPYEGFEVLLNEFLSRVARIPGALIIQNEKSKKVLLPANELSDDPFTPSRAESYDKSLVFKEISNELFHEYNVDETGHLIPLNREAAYHLAYVYVIQRNYDEAFKLISKTPHWNEFSHQELKWLNAIIKTSKDLFDPRANSIRIHVYLLGQENLKRAHTTEKNISYETLRLDLHAYLNSLSELPPLFLISPQRIRDQVPFAYYSPEVDRYLKIDSGEMITATSVIRVGENRVPSVEVLTHALNKALENGSSYIYKDALLKPNKNPVYSTIPYLELIMGDTYLTRSFREVYLAAHKADRYDQKSHMQTLLNLCANPLESDLVYFLRQVLDKPENFPEPDVLLAWDSYSTTSNVEITEKLVRQITSFPSTERQYDNDYSGYVAAKTVTATEPTMRHAEVELKENSESAEVTTAEILAQYSTPEKMSSLWAPRYRLLHSVQAKFQTKIAEIFIPTPAIETQKKASDEKESKENMSLSDRIRAINATEKNSVTEEALLSLEADIKFFQAQDKGIHYIARDLLGVQTLMADTEKEIKALKMLEEKTKACIEELGNKPSPDRREELANQLGISAQLQTKMQVKHFLIPYLRRNPLDFQARNPHLSQEDAKLLHDEMGQFLLIATQKQKLERSHKALKSYLEVAQKKMPDEDLLRDYAQTAWSEMHAKRDYDMREHPEYLIYEYCRDLSLRKEQVMGIDTLTDVRTRPVQQMVMGGGKTDIMAFLIALTKADGKNLSMMLVPTELFADFSHIMETQGFLFDKEIRCIDWDDVSEKGLDAIYKELVDICENKKILIATDTEMKRFFLAAQLALIKGTSLEKFRKIKQLLKTCAHPTIDEIHQQDSRHDYRIAVGDPTQIDSRYLNISVMLYE